MEKAGAIRMERAGKFVSVDASMSVMTTLGTAGSAVGSTSGATGDSAAGTAFSA
jgi:hypothetical protein